MNSCPICHKPLNSGGLCGEEPPAEVSKKGAHIVELAFQLNDIGRERIALEEKVERLHEADSKPCEAHGVKWCSETVCQSEAYERIRAVLAAKEDA